MATGRGRQRGCSGCGGTLGSLAARVTCAAQNKLKLQELREQYGIVDTWLREAMDGLEAQICAFLDTAFTQVAAGRCVCVGGCHIAIPQYMRSNATLATDVLGCYQSASATAMRRATTAGAAVAGTPSTAGGAGGGGRPAAASSEAAVAAPAASEADRVARLVVAQADYTASEADDFSFGAGAVFVCTSRCVGACLPACV